jgi:hypothetical protein
MYTKAHHCENVNWTHLDWNRYGVIADFCEETDSIRAELAEKQFALITLMKESISISETPVSFYQITRRSIPETAIFILVALKT